MGCIEPFEDDIPFEERLKLLADEELLDVWVESQQLGAMLDDRLPGHEFPRDNFEMLIIHELSLRTGRRLAAETHGS